MKPNIIIKILVITLIGLPVLVKAQISNSFILTQPNHQGRLSVLQSLLKIYQL